MKIEEPAIKYERLMSADEYLEWERQQEERHEYAEGFIITMQGASRGHERIITNLIRNISSFLKGRPCEIYPSNLKVHVKSKESYFYPDASIICENDSFEGPLKDITEVPLVIFEVLSPSTSDFDLGKKFFYYAQLNSLKEYIVIDPAKIFVRVAGRQPDNSWKFEEYYAGSDVLQINSIQFQMEVEEVYFGVIAENN